MKIRARLLQVLMSVGILVSLVACADNSKPTRITRDHVPVYEYGSENEALKATKNWTVNCQDSRNCPNTVAQLVVAVGTSVGVCTATLIAPDTAITNSHCFDISTHKVKLQSMCEKGAVLVFPSNSSSGREVVECQSIISKSKISKESMRTPDYMILKLKKSLSRGYDKFDFSGIADGDRLVVRKVNPVGREFGSLVVNTCEAMHGTFLVSSATDPLAPVHIASGCDVMPGNSGSSVLDSQGRIRGLIFATLIREKLESLAGQLPELSYRRLTEMRPSYITNAACISELPGRQISKRCLTGLTEAENSYIPQVDLVKTMETVEYEGRTFQGAAELGYASRESGVQEGAASVINMALPICYKANFSFQPFLSVPVLKIRLEINLSERLQLKMDMQKGAKTCHYSLQQGTRGILASSSQAECLLSKESHMVWTPCEAQAGY